LPVAIEVLDDPDKTETETQRGGAGAALMAAVKKQTISSTPDGLPVQDFTRRWPIWRR
jgi:hypothetical protein